MRMRVQYPTLNQEIILGGCFVHDWVNFPNLPCAVDFHHESSNTYILYTLPLNNLDGPVDKIPPIVGI